jgi:hypothetical protein
MKTCCAMVMASVALVLASAAGSQGTNSPPETPVTVSTNEWGFSATAYGYFVPHSRDYVNPNFTASRGWLYLEARYNYEAFETGSLWTGYNFSVGDKLAFEATPMVGGVFGKLNGVAPGCNLSLSYKKFTLASQSEYVFDASGSSGNFFYTWSELSYSPVKWFRAGLAIQRTKAYKTDFDIQRGLLAGVSYKKIDFTAYVFNLGWTTPTVVLGIGVNF